jgi:hypothetical protein
MKRIFFVLAITGFCMIFAQAQIADADDNQSWNDLQVTVPVNKQFDFTLAGTLRFGKNITQLNDRRVAIGFVYKPSKAKSWSFQPFYWNIVARNASGRFLMEHRLNFRAIYRFPFKRIAVSHRSWIERRLREPRNSWRYRPSLTFEKDVGKIISGVKLFVTEEIFYDSVLRRFSRNRFSAGVNKTLTKNSSVDVFYLRQNDGFSRPGDLNVIGTTWRVKL